MLKVYSMSEGIVKIDVNFPAGVVKEDVKIHLSTDMAKVGVASAKKAKDVEVVAVGDKQYTGE